MAATGMDTTAPTSDERCASTARLGLFLSLLIVGGLVATPVAAYDHPISVSSAQPNSVSTNPFLQQRPPLSVPVKALVERFLLGSHMTDGGRRKFRYDIDTLGHGMKVRMRMRF